VIARGWPPAGAADWIYLAALGALFLIPFAVYSALLAAGRVAPPPGRAGGGGRRLLGPLLVGFYYWMLGPLVRLIVRTPLAPNHVTAAALVGAAAAAVAIATGHFAAASALLVGGATLDMIDGQLARAKGMGSRRGAFFDSTIDRIADGLIFGGCVVYYAGGPMMYVALLALVMCFTISYARSRGESLGLSGAEGLMQRADRIVILGAALALSPLVAHHTEGFVAHPFYGLTAGALCVLAVLNTATAIARIAWTMKNLEESPARGSLPGGGEALPGGRARSRAA
jgi:CDP-diacylglycerol--glycerol-3-phosphate 3-phosphatidyltransferase